MRLCLLQLAAMADGAFDPAEPVGQRLAQLELTLFDVIAALGMLVGEIASRDDLELTTPAHVEGALGRAWQTLFDPVASGAGLVTGAAMPASREVVPDWADPGRLQTSAAAALEEAVTDTGAAVGAVYAVEADGTSRLVASLGYPAEVMEQFAVVPRDSELPVAQVARSEQALWFAQRAEIIDRYPHLREAHERTEQAVGRTAVQGAVVPLIARGRIAAVVILGFAEDAPAPELAEVRSRVVRSITTARQLS
jgi:hypothetical protein